MQKNFNSVTSTHPSLHKVTDMDGSPYNIFLNQLIMEAKFQLGVPCDSLLEALWSSSKDPFFFCFKMEYFLTNLDLSKQTSCRCFGPAVPATTWPQPSQNPQNESLLAIKYSLRLRGKKNHCNPYPTQNHCTSYPRQNHCNSQNRCRTGKDLPQHSHSISKQLNHQEQPHETTVPYKK